VDIGAIDERAAVGPDAPAYEGPRRTVNDLLLPRLENDPPLVFRARSVLREETGEVRAVDRIMDTAWRGHCLDGVVREASPEKSAGVPDDPWIFRVQHDAQSLRPRMLRDGAVA
jgi:hypothetical protein